MSGMRQLRKLLSEGGRIVRLNGSEHAGMAEPEDSEYADAVHLDRSEYTEVR